MDQLSRATRGVIPIVPTPFDAGGGLAVEDIPGLVEYYRMAGVCGLTILGVMGEAGKLSPSETLSCIEAFLESAGDLPVIIGASGASLAGSAELGIWAMERGAAGVMLQPIAGAQGDDAVARYFELFVEKTGGAVPICVQDYPTASGVNLGLAAWCRISRLAPVFMLKHEPMPSLQKLSRIRRAEAEGQAERVSILTSINAMHLPQELARGADGAMVGVAYSDRIVEICRLHFAGETEAAHDHYDALLPLIRHENQGPFGLAIRKEILRRRGALSSAQLRYPSVELDREDLAELDVLIERLERRLAALGYPANAANSAGQARRSVSSL